MTFDESLAVGQAGEDAIALFLRRQGTTVMPAYEKIIDNGKGPRLFTPTCTLVSPDFLCWNEKGVVWIEAKSKSAFTWSRRHGRWTTGIDLPHYFDYLRVNDESPFPVWLLFLQRGGMAKDTPEGKVSPTGLFGNSLAHLRNHENHRDVNGGPHGMVYWAHDALKLIRPLEGVTNATHPH